MKHRTSSMPALLLAALGSATVLALTAVIAIALLILGSLGNIDCQNCHDLSGVFADFWSIVGVGVAIAIIAFWAIFRGMRPPHK